MSYPLPCLRASRISWRVLWFAIRETSFSLLSMMTLPLRSVTVTRSPCMLCDAMYALNALSSVIFCPRVCLISYMYIWSLECMISVLNSFSRRYWYIQKESTKMRKTLPTLRKRFCVKCREKPFRRAACLHSFSILPSWLLYGLAVMSFLECVSISESCL